MLAAGVLDLVTDHPDAACYFDLGSREMTLNSGAKAPVLGVYDTDGEPLNETDLDLCSHIIVAFVVRGYVLKVCARARDAVRMAA